jgi:DNA-binding transcriptional LysR family regulator
MDQLFAIRAFVAVARRKNLTKAAKDLGVSTSAISRAVMQHERDLQMRLLHRTTRTVTLNEDAKTYFESCAQALDLLDEARQRAAREKQDNIGELRLAVHPMIVCDLLPRILSRYRAMAPEVSVIVQITGQPVNLVDDQIDLGILPSSLVNQGNVYRKKLRATRRILVATPAYLDTGSQLKHVSDLAAHVLLLESRLCEGEGRTIEVVDGSERVEIAANSRIEGTGAALREAVMAGMGIACISEAVVANDVAVGALRHVLPNCRLSGDRVDLCLFYLERQFMSSRCRSFMNLCTSLFEEANDQGYASLSKGLQLAVA